IPTLYYASQAMVGGPVASRHSTVGPVPGPRSPVPAPPAPVPSPFHYSNICFIHFFEPFMKIRRLLVPLLLIAAAAGIYRYVNRTPSSLTLTGVVTTNDVIISPQIAGQLQKLLVSEGETVKKGQLVAVIVPDELAADTAYYTHSLE